jgi:integrase/recombinase XerD
MDTPEELRALLARWAKRLGRRSPQTARSYRHAVGGFIGSLGEEPLSTEGTERWVEGLQRLAPASQAHRISAVRTFLRFGQTQGVVSKSPIDVLVRPRVTVTSYGRYLTVDELAILFGAARDLSPRHYGTVAALTLTGCRVSELAAARWGDLYRDPAGRLGLRIVGKGGKERAVKIREDLFRALATLHGSAELDSDDTAPLIPGERSRGGVPACSTRTLQRLVSESVDRAVAMGLKKKQASAHFLRHSHATLAAAAGADAFVIQASLGHSRLETSQRYVHLARGLAQTTVDALPELP